MITITQGNEKISFEGKTNVRFRKFAHRVKVGINANIAESFIRQLATIEVEIDEINRDDYDQLKKFCFSSQFMRISTERSEKFKVKYIQPEWSMNDNQNMDGEAFYFASLTFQEVTE